MPYRRLPNTDQARLKALQKAVQRASEEEYSNQVLQYSTLTEAQRFVLQFENQVSQYQNNFNSRVSASRQYRKMVQNARMYISHFIQVLNLAVVRGEIKKEQKRLYGLDPNVHILPDLSSDEALLEWGERIIKGEEERVRMGGYPIYNPSITKVKVYYDIFKEDQTYKNMYRKNATRVFEDLSELRKQADEIILNIWNTVENHYKDFLPYARYTACKAYGVIYYYRTGEKKLTPETDKEILRLQRIQPQLNL